MTNLEAQAIEPHIGVDLLPGQSISVHAGMKRYCASPSYRTPTT